MATKLRIPKAHCNACRKPIWHGGEKHWGEWYHKKCWDSVQSKVKNGRVILRKTKLAKTLRERK